MMILVMIMRKCLIMCLSFFLVCMCITDLRAASKIDQLIKKMSLKEKVSQMMLAYQPDDDPAGTQAIYQFGGYLLFSKDFDKLSPDKKREEIKNMQKASDIGMFIGVDEEGGSVCRVSTHRNYQWVPFLSPRQVYDKDGWTGLKAYVYMKTLFLYDLGINTNLAPVADTPYTKNDFIYDRSFSTRPKNNARFIRHYLSVTNKMYAVSCLKHFPGYGGNGDTHTDVITDKRSLKTFESRDLLPFKAGIKAGVSMIMVSHNIVTCMDKKNPASLSKKVHQYVRDTLKYEGILISDGLEMEGVRKIVNHDDGESAVRAIIAGNDMICAAFPVKQRNAIVEAVQNGRIKESQIDMSVRRILRVKEEKGLL